MYLSQPRAPRRGMLPPCRGHPWRRPWLGPLLFLIFINDICNAVPGSQVKLFADDTNLFIFGCNLDTVFVNANRDVTLLNDWFRCNKLSLNVDKTNYSVFSRAVKALIFLMH